MIFWSKRTEVTWGGENCVLKSFIVCAKPKDYLHDEIKEKLVTATCFSHTIGHHQAQSLQY
jgi:hypothetical protein